MQAGPHAYLNRVRLVTDRCGGLGRHDRRRSRRRPRIRRAPDIRVAEDVVEPGADRHITRPPSDDDSQLRFPVNMASVRGPPSDLRIRTDHGRWVLCEDERDGPRLRTLLGGVLTVVPSDRQDLPHAPDGGCDLETGDWQPSRFRLPGIDSDRGRGSDGSGGHEPRRPRAFFLRHVPVKCQKPRRCTCPDSGTQALGHRRVRASRRPCNRSCRPVSTSPT